MCNAQPSTVLNREEVRECSRKSNNANTFSKSHFKLARLKLNRDVGGHDICEWKANVLYIFI